VKSTVIVACACEKAERMMAQAIARVKYKE
jgi:hypothetical protein